MKLPEDTKPLTSEDYIMFIAAIGIGPERGPIWQPTWSNISHGNAEYARWMNRSAWGRRIYDHVQSMGWLDRPDFHTLTGEDMIALGVPGCK